MFLASSPPNPGEDIRVFIICDIRGHQSSAQNPKLTLLYLILEFLSKRKLQVRRAFNHVYGAHMYHAPEAPHSL